MKFLRLLLLPCCFLFLKNADAQDIHFSMFNMMPTMLNPAHTGAFNGTVRVGGIYRDQWGSFLGDQFQTPGFYADAPVLIVRKHDWVGVGLTVYQDKAGSLGLKNGGFLLGASYHLAMDKRRKNVLTLGVQGGTVQRELDQMMVNNARFADQLIEGNFTNPSASPDFQNLTGMGTNSFDLNAGLMLTGKPTKEALYRAGFAVHHILTPNYSILNPSPGSGGGGNGPDPNDLPVRLTVHGELEYDLDGPWSLNPSLLFMNINNQNQVNLLAWAGYLVNEDKDVTLRFGLGHRFGRDGEILLGVDVKDLRVAASYDLNFSQLQDATNVRGGFEIGARYIIKVYQTPELPTVILCPEL